MTDPTYLALLAAVCESPNDDAPRLILADRLDELGDGERAEFVRCQVELARLPCPEVKTVPTEAGDYAACRDGYCADCRALGRRCRYHGLQERVGKLWWAVGQTVEAELPDIGSRWAVGISDGQIFPAPSAVMGRGFVQAVRLDWKDWVAHGDILSWRPDSGRPCPPTAQPIAHVTLTSWPELDSWHNERDRRYEFNLRGRVMVQYISEMARLYANPSSLGLTADGRPATIIRGLLRTEWPAVRTWVLPDANAHDELPELMTPARFEAIARRLTR